MEKYIRIRTLIILVCIYIIAYTLLIALSPLYLTPNLVYIVIPTIFIGGATLPFAILHLYSCYYDTRNADYMREKQNEEEYLLNSLANSVAV